MSLRVRAMLCVVALLIGAGGGYVAGAAEAPSDDEAAEARTEAEDTALAEAKEQAFQEGLEAGRAEGTAAGQKKGAKQGESQGAADGAEVVAARDAEAAEAAAAEEDFVYCMLGPNAYIPASECQAREDLEGYCGGPGSPEC